VGKSVRRLGARWAFSGIQPFRERVVVFPFFSLVAIKIQNALKLPDTSSLAKTDQQSESVLQPRSNDSGMDVAIEDIAACCTSRTPCCLLGSSSIQYVDKIQRDI
jgi:hypothetical protein